MARIGTDLHMCAEVEVEVDVVVVEVAVGDVVAVAMPMGMVTVVVGSVVAGKSAHEDVVGSMRR